MIHPVGTQTIETERCILRRIAPGDAHLMYENWARHEEVYRFFPFDPIESEEAYREKVCKWAGNDESGSYFHWVIVWKENGEPDGTINYKLGAYFECNGSREFFTPKELAALALNGYAVIPGLQIEDRQENLADRIQAAERRAKALAKIQAQAPTHAISAPYL